mmetsp:Transcript_15437/g.46101  ORF Transcript_15437/g.46101 Transcript_15437/m.46101 type:complete len:384 (+) Transcript_15437:141-1292(+)
MLRRAATSRHFSARPARRALPQGPSFADFVRPPAPLAEQPVEDAAPLPRRLLEDRFGRHHGYLRISLTERCNLRCKYCMPAEGVSDLTPQPQLLTAREIERVASVFARAGASKVRLTGGEPTLRRDLADVCRAVRRPGVRSVGLTTNAVNLLGKGQGGTRLDDLVAAGVDSINVSLDSLDAEAFGRMTRRPPRTHDRVLEAIQACADAGIRTKVNCVVLRGENDHELAAFASHWGPDVSVRFIEWMPFAKNEYDASRLVPYVEMVARIPGLEEAPSADPHDTTRWWRRADGARVGFITSMTDHFCGGCNRVRVTADGQLKTCLFGADALDLRALLRAGRTDLELADAVHGALQRKHFKHGGLDGVEGIAERADENRPMVRIGG